MNPYTITLFLHVTGDIGIFIGVGVQLLTLAALRRATQVEQGRTLTGLMTRVGPLSAISALLTIATGLYMALTAWGWQVGWTTIALASLILLMPPLGIMIEPRTRAMVTLAKEAPDGPLPAELDRRIHDPILGTALQTQVALVLGIVFLMTNKPEFMGALMVIGVALILGLISSIPLWVTYHQKSRMSL
jgi:MFS family permease